MNRRDFLKLAGATVFLPVVHRATATDSAKGVAGYCTTAQLDAMGATWAHGWCLRKPGWDSRFVHCVKSFETDMGDTLPEVKAAVQNNGDGWLMFGDEWLYQEKPMDWQVEQLHRIVQIRDNRNPACKIAFGGVLQWHPSFGSGESGARWCRDFVLAYRAAYGDWRPPVQAVVMDTYDWAMYGGNWKADTEAMVDAAKTWFGQYKQIWAREVGSLISHQAALDAVGKFRDMAHLFDRYAWFMSYEQRWAYTSLWDARGNLTDLGELYAGLEPIAMHRLYLPQIWRN